MTKAVVWGVEGTLVHIPNHIVDIIPQRTADAVRKLLPAERAVDAESIKGMARAAFNANGMPCRDVAAQYGLDEGLLMGQMYNMVARNDVWPHQAHFARPNQHWLNLFEKSREAGIRHFAVTSGSGEWGQRVATRGVGVDQFMSGVAGAEIIRKVAGSIMNRHEAGAPVAAWLTRGLNRGDVLVVDHDADYIKSARTLGFQGVRLTDDMTLADIFRERLNITADSRRGVDDHVWAGVAMGEEAHQRRASNVRALRA